MKFLTAFFRWLELLGLALWVGGMVTLGALVAPTVFDTIQPVASAGEAMSVVFRKFNGGLVYVCIGLAAAGFLGHWAIARPKGASHRVKAGMLAVMAAVGLYLGAVLGPRMQELRQIRMTDPSNTGAVVDFDRGHRRSETLFSINLLLGIGLLFLNARETGPNGTGRR